MEEFALHNFNVQWHHLQFSQCQKELPLKVLLQVLDFSQNYTIYTANKVQSAYWDATSVAMHGIVCYYRCQVNHVTNW